MSLTSQSRQVRVLRAKLQVARETGHSFPCALAFALRCSIQAPSRCLCDLNRPLQPAWTERQAC